MHAPGSGYSTPLASRLRPPPINAPALSDALSALASGPVPISPLSRQRRAPLPGHAPAVIVQETSFKYTLNVQLPNTISPEMVTITAVKGDKMKVVADAWHMESNCHYEWLITFPPRDIDMSTVHAKFGQDGLLSIDVRRLHNSAQY
ncbi:hypothetical protein CPB85DRAFT_1226304 [Mucidula mucida]|nr:hypothetical protein CPB85DRAFT_1226304 [Mucidula mucida]